MTNSLRTLLNSSIDYAGLFPPARLPMEPAIRNYARYRTDPDAWMLARFVCPTARLGELIPLGDELFAAGPPFAFALLPRGGETADQFLQNLELDLRDAAEFRERFGNRVALNVFEMRLPPDLVTPSSPSKLVAFMSTVIARAWDFARATVFYEASVAASAPETEWRRIVSNVAEAVHVHHPSHEHAGFKLRTGGVEAAAFPSPGQVACAIAICRDRDILWKATAGLHHPIRHFDPTVQTKVHGFLNVFCAAALAGSAQLDEAQIRSILEDETAANFAFHESSIVWQDYSAELPQVANCRQSSLISFGSCSFDEPRADLRVLGLL